MTSQISIIAKITWRITIRNSQIAAKLRTKRRYLIFKVLSLFFGSDGKLFKIYIWENYWNSEGLELRVRKLILIVHQCLLITLPSSQLIYGDKVFPGVNMISTTRTNWTVWSVVWSALSIPLQIKHFSLGLINICFKFN